MARTVTKTLFSFTELSEEAQETAIEQWRDHTRGQWDSYDTEDATDVDYWQEEKLAPMGITLKTHSVKLMNGTYRQEPTVHWQAHYNRDLHFPATVDVPAFMKARKIAGKCRALYHAACNGDVDAWIAGDSEYRSNVPPYRVSVEYTGEHEPEYLFSRDTDWTKPLPVRHTVQSGRIAAQLAVLESELETVYDDIRYAWLKAIEENIEYRESDEYIREELAEFYTEEQFNEDGELDA